mmetsp:Transcript_77568/g.199729  ORF Transcript_77568/g.199729 Transcript_77568/m.199729 type:complete len:152 (-) Transcript_77568:173-628(-)|eukprot:CAMPEP_0195116670 /NCGR_PEP_ID=MMETSP0448-20130528/112482_1 /TAXON_ID=66468 /ORGANISM="Heterocapsa triquestra, Strain CCMP 448" /LENGTH=151 /DNA_ID=CAMNT_0040153849 /DNA_START=52 /DNA_END=507 /DNA_ORIENTATION=-
MGAAAEEQMAQCPASPCDCTGSVQQSQSFTLQRVGDHCPEDMPSERRRSSLHATGESRRPRSLSVKFNLEKNTEHPIIPDSQVDHCCREAETFTDQPTATSKPFEFDWSLCVENSVKQARQVAGDDSDEDDDNELGELSEGDDHDDYPCGL